MRRPITSASFPLVGDIRRSAALQDHTLVAYGKPRIIHAAPAVCVSGCG